jgi:hypothetical protein
MERGPWGCGLAAVGGAPRAKVHPVEWELEVRKSKTKKLLKSLPESEMTK